MGERFHGLPQGIPYRTLAAEGQYWHREFGPAELHILFGALRDGTIISEAVAHGSCLGVALDIPVPVVGGNPLWVHRLVFEQPIEELPFPPMRQDFGQVWQSVEGKLPELDVDLRG